jgi:uracil-DNA glycosylase
MSMNLQLPSKIFADWRESARRGLTLGVPPERFNWYLPELCVGDESLAVASPMVPGTFLTWANKIALHKDESKWTVLYKLLWRMHHGEPFLLQEEQDADVARALFLGKAVDRDILKMQLFVRFHESHGLKVAWYKPEHFISEDVATYFVRKMPEETWLLHTPQLTVRWSGKELEYSAGLETVPRFLIDEGEDVWQRYYHAQFNPHRERIRVSGSDMQLCSGGVTQVASRPKNPANPPPPKTKADPPETAQLSRLKSAAKSCLVCPFARNSTQTVFGEGPKRAALMLIGEQPGDQEDRSGHPFVGPAGAMLDEILKELGVPRDEVYVTNAVKHFKFIQRGKRRLHQKPNGSEMSACRPWLEKEIAAVRPKVIIALGATAAASLCVRTVKITTERGEWLDTEWAENSKALATWHPSAILRSMDEQSAKEKREQLKSDLKKAWNAVKKLSSMRAIPSSHEHRI